MIIRNKNHHGALAKRPMVIFKAVTREGVLGVKTPPKFFAIFLVTANFVYLFSKTFSSCGCSTSMQACTKTHHFEINKRSK